MVISSSHLKIHIHDFAGHPFQAELSNELSNLGFEVTHSFFGHLGPTKALLKDIHNSGRISFRRITLKQDYEVHHLIKRLIFEVKLAAKLIHLHRKIRPALTIFANTPLITASLFKLFTFNSKFILWHQDIFSLAIALRFKTTSPRVSRMQMVQIKIVGNIEKWLVQNATHVVCISDAFLEVYRSWKVEMHKVSVVENWAPLEQIQYVTRKNSEIGKLTFVYAGTLGLKHNPQLMVDLIEELCRLGHEPHLMVISEGDGAKYLQSKMKFDLPINTMGFMPIEELNEELASANFALMLLEADASEFSVPSKTYSYLAAGKCVVAFAPASNAASMAITKSGGFVFDPSHEGVLQAAFVLSRLESAELINLEVQARKYAVNNFQIADKCTIFTKIINSAINLEEASPLND